MLTADQHDAAADLPPELALPFEALCSALAVKLTARSAQFDELNAKFSAMQSIVTRAICDSSKEWNRSHDYLRVLPQELRAMCWSYLPQSDLVRLARVCSSWRDLSHGTPSLWSTLNVTGVSSDLEVLFSRSARLPLDVSVTVHSFQEHACVDECVRKHADRLRALRISDRDVLSKGNRPAHKLFRYPAPVLAHFSFKLLDQHNQGDFILPADIFNGHAPNLRSLTLHEIPFLAGCPAFSCLTMLEFQWGLDILEPGLEHVFAVSPGLELLALSNIRDVRCLPPVPSPCNLRRMTLTTETSCFTTLYTLGYLGIPRLQVSTRHPRVLYEAAKCPDTSLHATLTIAATGATVSELVLRSERGTMATFTTDVGSVLIPRIILEQTHEFPRLERLVIPSTGRHRYLPDDLHLPALRTLALAHGPYCETSVFDSTLVRGVLSAPRLSRLEIVRAGSIPHLASLDLHSINPGLLAQFIEEHIKCGDPAALEVYVATENIDLLDIGGMERLRHAVGKIVYG